MAVRSSQVGWRGRPEVEMMHGGLHPNEGLSDSIGQSVGGRKSSPGTATKAEDGGSCLSNVED